MAAALGVGRFVYTPILPAMLATLGWSKSDAGLVASANFLGYLVGALLAGRPLVASRPRAWLLTGLGVSALSTVAMAAPSDIAFFATLRFIGGIASAFVIVCASTLVLERLSCSGHGSLSVTHFAGVGFGILISAIAVSAMLAFGAGWRSLWIGSGAIAALGAILAAWLIPPAGNFTASPKPKTGSREPSRLGAMIVAYGLFGFGYVITATFLVTIVRLTEEVPALEPWVWVLFGLAAIPSVAFWTRLGERIGIMNAFAAGCVIETIGVAASVESVTISGVCFAALLLGGTFMGLTALGFMAARVLSTTNSHQTFGRMTASFGIGQMLGPILAGVLSEQSGSFRAAFLIAAAALTAAAALAVWTSVASAEGRQGHSLSSRRQRQRGKLTISTQFGFLPMGYCLSMVSLPVLLSIA
jgi:MFS family permease